MGRGKAREMGRRKRKRKVCEYGLSGTSRCPREVTIFYE
jgi:hypothetical protein